MPEEFRGIRNFQPIVAVPARNEEKRLPALLASLAAQSWIACTSHALPIVIVLNNCSDRSKEEVGEGTSRYPELDIKLLDVVFREPDAHVGSARRLAMETAYDAIRAPHLSAILTTDADAIPRPDWVAANLSHLSDGVDLVGGLIVGDTAEEERLGPDFKVRALLHQRYGRAVDRLASIVDPLPHDPWPRHHDHTGASIAVRADAYRAVGGMPALPFREDLAFVDRVRCNGFLVRHPLDVVVGVSARLAGRAAGGMADCLKDWMRASASGERLLVEDPERVLERLHKRRWLRKLAATSSNMSPLGDLADSLVPDEPDAPVMMYVETAISIVEDMVKRAEKNTRAA